jgi:hypothetical protein
VTPWHKLSKEQAKFLDNDLSLKELQEALSTCKYSTPGPNGIPYIRNTGSSLVQSS